VACSALALGNTHGPTGADVECQNNGFAEVGSRMAPSLVVQGRMDEHI